MEEEEEEGFFDTDDDDDDIASLVFFLVFLRPPRRPSPLAFPPLTLPVKNTSAPLSSCTKPSSLQESESVSEFTVS